MAIQNYKTQRRTKKWWKAVFFYILDVTLKNLSIIYFSSRGDKKEERNMALKFRELLLEELLEQFLPSNNSEEAIREKHIKVQGEKKQQDCQNCKKLKICKDSCHYPRTNFICKKCQIFLCKKCFEYHINSLINNKK